MAREGVGAMGFGSGVAGLWMVGVGDAVAPYFRLLTSRLRTTGVGLSP